MTEKEKLQKLSSGTSLGWLDDAEFVENNAEMLEMSAKVAIAILKVMKQRKLTKRELSRLLGISPQSVSKQLGGNANFTFETLQKYCKVLDMEFDLIAKYKGKILLEEDIPSTVAYCIHVKSQTSPMRYINGVTYNYEWMS